MLVFLLILVVSLRKCMLAPSSTQLLTNCYCKKAILVSREELGIAVLRLSISTSTNPSARRQVLACALAGMLKPLATALFDHSD